MISRRDFSELHFIVFRNATSYSFFILVSMIFLLLSGCGTVNTVFRGDEVASRNLKKYRTHCRTVSRVYSGAAYDFCVLYGEPAAIPPSQFQNAAPAVVSDFPFSAVLDTFVLPYTIIRQIKDGNIKVNRRFYNSVK